jgi:hypothetical protein
MPYDISGVNSTLRLVFSQTFPAGFTVSEWANDADAIDINVKDIAEGGMGAGGDAVYWAVPKLVEVTINVIPDSPSDIYLMIAAQANTAVKGKLLAKDVVTGTYVNQNDGKIVTFNSGRLTKAAPANSVGQDSKLKSKQYMFLFESVTA